MSTKWRGGRRCSRVRSLVWWCCLGVGFLSEESEDVDEVEGMATMFSGEVVGLVVLSGVGVLSGERVDVDEVEGRGGGVDVLDEVLGLWCYLWFGSYLGIIEDVDEVDEDDDVLVRFLER